MKFTIRRSVFETNSSSMHSFSWVKIFEPDKLNIPKKLYVRAVDFGWFHPIEFDLEEGSTEEKVSYLYSAAIQFEKVGELKKILFNIADTFNFKIYFEDVDMDKFYGIDWNSSSEAKELLCTMLNNEADLLNFLFRDDTDIIITNDNKFEPEIARGGADRKLINF